MSASQPVAVRSMTGFGAAEATAEGLTVRAEVRTVNNRGLKFSARAPAALDPHAKSLEDAVRTDVARGTVWLNVSLDRVAEQAPGRIVPAVLQDYARQLREVAGDGREPPLEALLRLPGVVEHAQEPTLTEAQVAMVTDVVREAAAAMVVMREREGRALAEDLRAYMERMRVLAGEVETRVPAALQEHGTRLRERLEELLSGATEVTPELLAREAAVLADKTDVAEEVQRLRSHVDQALEALDAGGPLGRRLDFVAQEMGREANTIGAKSQDPVLSRAVVELKLVVERVKEQAANVE